MCNKQLNSPQITTKFQVLPWRREGVIKEGGEIGLFFTLVPKVLYYRFLIRWLNNFWDLY